MASGSPPKAPPPELVINTKVSSQRDSVQGGAEKIMKAGPGGQTLRARDMGEKIPIGVAGRDHLEFGPQPDIVSETNMAPELSSRPSSGGEGIPVPPATFSQPEAPGALLAALKSASIIDEHCALMGDVIEKIRSVENGLNKACIDLIRGFEVCLIRFRRDS